MKKYLGMVSYYRGEIEGLTIEAITESALFRLASKIANKAEKTNRNIILLFDYVSVDENMMESILLPQQYYVRLSNKWVYQGDTPEDHETRMKLLFG